MNYWLDISTVFLWNSVVLIFDCSLRDCLCSLEDILKYWKVTGNVSNFVSNNSEKICICTDDKIIEAKVNN